MSSHQKKFTPADYKGYKNHRHGYHSLDVNHHNNNSSNNYLRYFNPSRYGTMEVDPPGISSNLTSTITTNAKMSALNSDTVPTSSSTGLLAATSTTLTNGDLVNGHGIDYNNLSENSFPHYKDYPKTKPFVNSGYVRDASKPINSYPTSDRDAVLSALRNLQDKVKKLELERMAAEHNLDALTSHTEQYKEMVNGGHSSTSPSKPNNTKIQREPIMSHTTKQRSMGQTYSALNNGRAYVNSHAKELDGQLTSAENRCQALEKQLDYMRKLVDSSERDRRELVEKTLKVKQEPDIKLHLDRINELERDQLRLNATQNLAEAKIRELEVRMGEEKLYRKKLQGKAAELETAFKDKKSSSSIIPPTSSSIPPPPPSQSSNVKPVLSTPKVKKPSKKKKKKRTSPRHHASTNHCKSEPTRHYRLNLAEIPFVAGKSTTASHSLGANVQKVLAMMKSHNAALCSQASNPHSNGVTGQGSDSCASSSGSMSSVTSFTDQDLTDLLNQLQEEFRQLSSDHQDLVQQLDRAVDKMDRLDLEQEIEVLTSRMESKAQQIEKMRNHQNKFEQKKLTTTKKTNKPKRTLSAGGRLTTTTNHRNQHQLNHQRNTQHSNQNKPSPRPQSAKSDSTGNSALGKPALFMLRDMKKLQTTLRRDDLCWK